MNKNPAILALSVIFALPALSLTAKEVPMAEPGGNGEIVFGSGEQRASDAHILMNRAARDAGLASLQWDGLDTADERDVRTMATELANADIALSRLTGLPQGALGLYGRIHLHLKEPTLGTGVSVSGRAKSNANGTVSIDAQPGSVAHEWMHALDFLINRSQRQAGSAVAGSWQNAYRTICEAKEWLGYMSGAAIMASALASMTDTDSRKTAPGYFDSEQERMAFAFSHYALAELGDSSPLLAGRRNGRFATPTPLEMNTLIRPAFRNLFRDVSGYAHRETEGKTQAAR